MTLKRIIINGRFLTHRITGVERYAREICAELDKLIKPGELVMAIPPETENIPGYKNIKVVRIGKLHNRMWEHISFPNYVNSQKAISLNLCNVAPLPDPGIVCIHDVKIKARPHDFSKKFLTWYNLLFFNECKRAKAIITVSEFSKHEIMKYYHVHAEKITVIPNAWQHYLKVGYDERALAKYGLQKDDYFFSMCSLEPNKNFKWIAEEAKKNPDKTFVVAGSINRTVFASGMGFECPNNMKLIGYVEDEEAKTLMRDCKAFLFPTFYEGFGIPPLEAFAAGCKRVYVSDTEVMHEVFGNSVQYIDPSKYDYPLDNLHYPEQNDVKVMLDKYTWEKNAKKLKKVLSNI